jgi:hypothetical protein|tara:strand:- start:248 stop:478 length:231 start_codon:yes stop_codon:yes gene_type:complete
MVLGKVDFLLGISDRALAGCDRNIYYDVVYSVASKNMRFAELVAQLVQPVAVIGLPPDQDRSVPPHANGSEIYQIL